MSTLKIGGPYVSQALTLGSALANRTVGPSNAAAGPPAPTNSLSIKVDPVQSLTLNQALLRSARTPPLVVPPNYVPHGPPAPGTGRLDYVPPSSPAPAPDPTPDPTPFDGVSRDEFNALNTSFGEIKDQLASLQTEYDKLVDRARRQRRESTGGIVGGDVVDDGSSLNPGQTSADSSGIGTTGKVYGPDGKEYSSAAAALAAGVMDFTFARPQLGPGLIESADTLGSQFLLPKANTGNANPGANIANQNVQLFEMGAPKIALPGQIKNPFPTPVKK